MTSASPPNPPLFMLCNRIPVILTQAVDALFQAAAVLEASSSATDTQEKVHESKVIIEQ